MKTLKDGMCQSLGRTGRYSSLWEEQGVTHPDFPAVLHHKKFKAPLHTAEDEQAARVALSKRTY